MPNCFAMGQAAGTASAIAVAQSLDSTREVNVGQLQEQLVQQGAWLGEEIQARIEKLDLKEKATR